MDGQPICSWACMESRHADCAGNGCVCRCHVTVAEKCGFIDGWLQCDLEPGHAGLHEDKWLSGT